MADGHILGISVRIMSDLGDKGVDNEIKHLLNIPIIWSLSMDFA